MPLTVPLPAIDRPGGRPLADHLKVAPAWVSVAVMAMSAMDSPNPSDWLPGLLTETLFDEAGLAEFDETGLAAGAELVMA